MSFLYRLDGGGRFAHFELSAPKIETEAAEPHHHAPESTSKSHSNHSNNVKLMDVGFSYI